MRCAMTMMLNPEDITPVMFDTMTLTEIDSAVKRWQREELADELVAMVGTRHEKDGKRYMCLRDVDAHRQEIVRMLPRVTYSIKKIKRGSVSNATGKSAHRNIGVAILKGAKRLGERPSMREKEEGVWYSCGNWQVLPRSDYQQ